MFAILWFDDDNLSFAKGRTFTTELDSNSCFCFKKVL